MRPTIIFLFFIYSLTALSQQRLSLKTSPIYLLDGDKRTLPIGLEYVFGNFSIQAEQMIMVTKQARYDLRENLDYNKTNLQVRYYLHNVFTRGVHGFFGIHGTVRNYDYFRQSGSFIDKNERNFTFRNSVIETRNYAGYVISGIQAYLSPRWSVETVVGLGVRELSVQHNAEVTTEQLFLDPILFEELEESWQEGPRTLPGLLFQIRLNYTFFNR